MAVTGSPFCEHKRLRTGCPQCKANAIPPAARDVTPFVTSDEREKKEARRAAREESGEPAEPKGSGRRGPAKPLMPTRAKKRGVDAADAARAEAWWVKRS